MKNMMPSSFITDHPLNNSGFVNKSVRSAFTDSPKSSAGQKRNIYSNFSYPSMIPQLLQTSSEVQMVSMDAQTSSSTAYPLNLNGLAFEMTKMVNPILSPYEQNISYDNFCW